MDSGSLLAEQLFVSSIDVDSFEWCIVKTNEKREFLLNML